MSNIVEDLRELADFLEKKPMLSCRVNMSNMSSIDINATTKDEFLELARQLGKFQKESLENFYVVSRKFGGIKLDVFSTRQVLCEQVEVGEEEVEVPDPAVKVPMVTRTIKKYEWKCPESILNLSDGTRYD